MMGLDMFSWFYDQILVDLCLLFLFKVLLVWLQIVVVCLVCSDMILLCCQDYFIWVLFNCVVVYGMVFECVDDLCLVEFLCFMEVEVQFFVDVLMFMVMLFQQVLVWVDVYIDQCVCQSSECNVVVFVVLECEYQCSDWCVLLCEQIDYQFIGVLLGLCMYCFLQIVWVDVIVVVMVRYGCELCEVQVVMELVDVVFDSLVMLCDMVDCEVLCMWLLVLIECFVVGCDSIQLFEVWCELVLVELMGQYVWLLCGQLVLDLVECCFVVLWLQMLGSVVLVLVDEIVKCLMEECDFQVFLYWFSVDVDCGELLMVLVQFYNENDLLDVWVVLQCWIDGLQIGCWFYFFIQGDWYIVQIVWISEGCQFMFFVGCELDECLLLMCKVFEVLLVNGFIIVFEDDSVVQCVVDMLMSDLDGG